MSDAEEPSSRLRALAGLLAEHAVQEVVLSHGGARRTLHARVTDLPRELETIVREGGVLEVPALEVSIQFCGSDVRCACPNTDLSIAILKALSVTKGR